MSKEPERNQGTPPTSRYVFTDEKSDCKGHDEGEKYTGPIIRLEGKNGMVIYPRMVPDGKGDWMISAPEIIREMLHESNGSPPLEEASDSRTS